MAKDWTTDAEAPEIGGRQYHTQCAPGDIAGYVLLPGDPARTDKIASTWTDAHKIADNREHRTFTGLVEGINISTTSTGMGGPSTAIAIEELLRVGAHTMIRPGTCGAIAPDIACGDLIINTAAVRHDGASNMYVEAAYPASADYEVVRALVDACVQLKRPYHIGITCSTGSFHCGQGRPGYKGYKQSFFENIVDDMRRANVLNFEMEAATLFTLGNLYGFRSGCICTVVANRITGEMKSVPLDPMIEVCNLAVRLLASRAAEKSSR